MAIEVETKDCTALTDAELEEMADICTDGPARYGIGILSKQREQWVLVQDDHIYFENISQIEHLRRAGTPWRVYRVMNTPVLQVFHLTL